MNRLRNRLIAVFLAATVLPLVVMGVFVSSLLERSLSYTTTKELSLLSQSLEETGRVYYVQARETLRKDVRSGEVAPQRFLFDGRAQWPKTVGEFWDSGEEERFTLSGEKGDRLDYLVRQTNEVAVYSRPLGSVHMEELRSQIQSTRELVGQANDRDLRRGLTTVLLILMAAVWLVSFGALIYVATRMSRPIQELTAGLTDLADGNLHTRITTRRNDEIGRAVSAFNHTAGELQRSRDRLIYLTQIASWQMLARKMAHELKNSLTPIRLTVEEIRAREPASDRKFMDQAVQIVVSEVESLERRVRAFSEFSSEPVVRLTAVNINDLIEERVAFLRTGRPEVSYSVDLGRGLPPAIADLDRVKGILTNLLENAAEAAGAGGEVLALSTSSGGTIHVEVHDSGPGLSDEARRTLFEPTITFKDRGMGLGLSIARKDALVCGGDLILSPGRLRGAAFRLSLKAGT